MQLRPPSINLPSTGRGAKTPTLVGVDIEPGHVAIAEVASAGAARVKRAAIAPLDAHVVRDGEVVDPEALAAVLREIWASHKGLSKKVRIGVANQRIVVRVLDLPPIAEGKELDAAVRFSAQEALPMPLESAVIDYVPVGEIETEDGPKKRVVLVAARRDMVDQILQACGIAGLRVEGLDLAAFGMARALRHADDPDQLLLSVGGLTNLAVIRGGVCTFTRVTGGGIEAMAVDLAERMALTLDHSRAWLRHVGLTTPVEQLEGDPDILAAARYVLAEGVRRLALETRQSLDFQRAQSPADAPIDHVVVTGPALQIEGFSATLEHELGMAVVPRAIDVAEDLQGIDPADVTVAAGLALGEARA
ncbi:MAG: type IV pilus assembly protein PilM [Patulibacter minatonensis]